MAESGYKPSRWTLVIGILLMIIGVYAWFHPATALVGLALYLGVVLVLIGVGYLIAFFGDRLSGWYLALGIIDIVVGSLFVSNLPTATAVIPFIVAIWALVVGAIQIVHAIDIRNIFPKVWGWPLVSGILGIIFALLIFYNPFAGAFAITVLLGLYLFLNGLLAVVECFSGRRSKV